MSCKLYILIILTVLPFLHSRAQDKGWDKVTVRKAYESGTADDYQPALISLTLPKESKNSFLINAGIGYGFDRNEKLHSDFTGFFVYNRNTLTDIQQKNYKLGVSSNHSFDLHSKALLAIFGTSTLQYLHDYINSGHSLIVTSYWQPVYKSTNKVHIGGYTASDHAVNYFLNPQVGLEHQQIISANGPARKGFDLRGYFNAGGSLIFKRKTYYSTADLREDLSDRLLRQHSWENRSARDLRDTISLEVPDNRKQLMEKRYWTKLVECNISYAGRLSLIDHHADFENYIPLFAASVTVYPVRTDNFSFSFSYNNGANPIDGTVKQTYWLLSLNFKK